MSRGAPLRVDDYPTGLQQAVQVAKISIKPRTPTASKSSPRLLCLQ